MTETRHCVTSGPANNQRLGALDRPHILLPDRKEGAAGLIWPRNRNGSRGGSTAGRPDTTELGGEAPPQARRRQGETADTPHSPAVPREARDAEPRPGDPH